MMKMMTKNSLICVSNFRKNFRNIFSQLPQTFAKCLVLHRSKLPQNLPQIFILIPLSIERGGKIFAEVVARVLSRTNFRNCLPQQTSAKN